MAGGPEHGSGKDRARVFLFLPILWATVISAQNGTPQPHEPCEGEGHVLRYLEFSLCHTEEHKQPRWVAYVLTAEELGLGSPLSRTTSLFKQDRSLEAGAATLQDYRNSGYDRGHLARGEYNYSSEQAYRECFLLSNMSPQIGRWFNQSGGLWDRAEKHEMGLVRTFGEVCSVSGPVFINELGSIGTGQVTVPGFFYKVITYKDTADTWRCAGYLFPHRAEREAAVDDHRVPVRLLEDLTGLDFNCHLPDTTQQRIEGAPPCR